MKIRIPLSAGLAILALSQPALAGSGLYFGGGLGIESPANSVWHVPSLNQVGHYDLKESNTFVLDAGYKFGSGLRVEIEGQYGEFDLSKLSIPTLPSFLKGHEAQATFYLNANYDVTLFQGWGGTLGVGLGSLWNGAHGTSGGLAILSGSDRAFSWQVMAGVSHEILSNVDLIVDYRYQGVGSTTVKQSGVGDFKFGGIKAQTVTLTARVYITP